MVPDHIHEVVVRDVARREVVQLDTAERLHDTTWGGVWDSGVYRGTSLIKKRDSAVYRGRRFRVCNLGFGLRGSGFGCWGSKFWVAFTSAPRINTNLMSVKVTFTHAPRINTNLLRV